LSSKHSLARKRDGPSYSVFRNVLPREREPHPRAAAELGGELLNEASDHCDLIGQKPGAV